MKNFQELLIELNACGTAKEWAKDLTIEEVIKNSYRGDWLLWLSKKLHLPLNKLTLAKARCAKTVLHLMKDQRSINGVNIAERFGLDECTLEDLNLAKIESLEGRKNAAADAADAADAAYAAAYAADAADAYADAYAEADAAADAADAAAAAADAAAYADAADAYAAYADAYADADAAADAAAAAYAYAKTKNQQQTSDICVELLGDLIIERVNILLNK